MSRLRPTRQHTRAPHYLRPGGPWTGGSLDQLMSAPGSRRHRVVDGSVRVDGTQLNRGVDDLAGRLRALGVRRGDAVAWQLPNSLGAMLLFRACWRLGAVAVPVHRGAGEAEVEGSLAQTSPRVVLGAVGTPAADRPGAGAVAPQSSSGDLLSIAGFDSLPDAPAVPADRSAARPTDLAAVIFTSGSTGRPKAVLHTQRGLAWKARSMTVAHGLTDRDVVLMPAPMAHISGLLNGVLLPVAAGMGSIPMARWDPGRALDIIEAEGVSFMIGPPTFFVGLATADGFRPERTASMRLVSSGGAAVTPGFVDMAGEALGCLVKRTYGSSEAPTVTTSFAGDDPNLARETDGRAVGEVELRLADPVGGHRLPPGSTGELWVRGPELFVGYADPADNVACHARGGWFRTGDLATISGDGWLRVVGRLKDVIIRGGENVSATEVETALESHPSVRQAVVVGYPDDLMGERVAAVVVAPPSFDLDACRRWCTGQGMARFKAPERLLHLPALPTLPSGKADRAAVRRLVAAEPVAVGS